MKKNEIQHSSSLMKHDFGGHEFMNELNIISESHYILQNQL